MAVLQGIGPPAARERVVDPRMDHLHTGLRGFLAHEARRVLAVGDDEVGEPVDRLRDRVQLAAAARHEDLLAMRIGDQPAREWMTDAVQRGRDALGKRPQHMQRVAPGPARRREDRELLPHRAQEAGAQQADVTRGQQHALQLERSMQLRIEAQLRGALDGIGGRGFGQRPDRRGPSAVDLVHPAVRAAVARQEIQGHQRVHGCRHAASTSAYSAE